MQYSETAHKGPFHRLSPKHLHRSRLVREFIELSEGHIVTEYLPAYAPELNPVEYIWSY